MKSFDKGVSEELGHYVYRLIDPRDGLTFYVGKGQGDRVFEHVRHEQRSEEEGENAEATKGRIIRQILDAGLEPHYIIHRHKMDDKTALEVEAAVMDAFCPAYLSNEVRGHGSNELGPATVEQLKQKYQPEYIPEDSPTVVIKITRRALDKKNGDYYQTVRASWRMKKQRFEAINSRRHHVAAVLNGKCVGLYSVSPGGWKESWKSEKSRPRYEFNGEEAEAEMWDRYVGKRVNHPG